MLHWLFGLLTTERVIAFATVGYLAVTLVMFFEIRSQARAAHRQANMMERQIALQEAAFRQWVTIDGWSVCPEWEDEDFLRMTFYFEIANKTNFPLVVHKVSIDCEAMPGHADYKLTEPESIGYTIPPNEVRKLDHEIMLGGDFPKWYLDKIDFPVWLEIKVAYTDCLGKEATQHTSLLCRFRQGEPSTFELFGSSEQRAKEKPKG